MAKSPGKKSTTTARTKPAAAPRIKTAAAKTAAAVTGAIDVVAAAAKPSARPRVAKVAPASIGGSQVVMTVTHDQIAQKAYEIWMAKGCPLGRDEENWREAEALLSSR